MILQIENYKQGINKKSPKGGNTFGAFRII